MALRLFAATQRVRLRLRDGVGVAHRASVTGTAVPILNGQAREPTAALTGSYGAVTRRSKSPLHTHTHTHTEACSRNATAELLLDRKRDAQHR